jgi:hypothetical protein
MQFPVPQFTDVEDRLIANLTIKQFGILFGAGVVIFLGYSATKSVIVIVLLSIIFGFPAIAVAFGKINGRPLYATFPMVMQYLTSPRRFVFKKEATANIVRVVKNVEPEKVEVKQSSGDRRGKLHELQLKLDASVEGKERLLRPQK